MKYRVLVVLNLRSTPNANRSDNVILRLRPNMIVEAIRIDNGWLQCKVNNIIGFCRYEERFLEKVAEEKRDLKPIILPTRQLITSQSIQWAFSINDPQAPKGNASEIIKYLQVESLPRYKRNGKDTYCNVYAHDFAHLYGAFVPRVWWINDLVQDKIQYAETVKELTANELNSWFDKFGADFNWIKTNDLDLLQNKVNEGSIGIISTNRPLPKPAHITVVVPETEINKAVRRQGKVTIPLQSQAGARNNAYFASAWYLGKELSNPTFWYLNK